MKEHELNLEYPDRVQGEGFIVNLVDTRAADPIRISYDFQRDGWVIEQSSVFEWDEDEIEFDRKWQEVAFCKAWQLEKACNSLS